MRRAPGRQLALRLHAHFHQVRRASNRDGQRACNRDGQRTSPEPSHIAHPRVPGSPNTRGVDERGRAVYANAGRGFGGRGISKCTRGARNGGPPVKRPARIFCGSGTGPVWSLPTCGRRAAPAPNRKVRATLSKCGCKTSLGLPRSQVARSGRCSRGAARARGAARFRGME